MIEARDLTKRFGDKLAVDHLSFSVQPGRVTGFLGPNGAGKSTTMRLILGLDRPNGGTATINGVPYARLPRPLLNRRRAARGQVRAHRPERAQPPAVPGPDAGPAAPAGWTRCWSSSGCASVAGKRAGGFSLGMSQRLGVAAAMLGDPKVLLLDEPVNGLDPEGVLWIRNLMKQLAGEGRTILVSSHLMNEMAVTADHLIVIGRGQLLADASTDEVIARGSGQTVRVRTPDPDRLTALITAAGGTAVPAANGNGPATPGQAMPRRCSRCPASPPPGSASWPRRPRSCCTS